jgi:O-acetyl-ADP-ribose deacetylase
VPAISRRRDGLEVIHVSQEPLEQTRVDGVVRAIRSDLAPVNASARDVGTAAGGTVAERLERVGSLPLGGAVVTPAGDLPAKFVIHVVIMSEDEPQTAASVRRALENGLRRASDFGMESLAVPALGIGVGNTEPEEAARLLVEILAAHVDMGAPPLDLTIAVSSPFEAALFERIVGEMLGNRTGDGGVGA